MSLGFIKRLRERFGKHDRHPPVEGQHRDEPPAHEGEEMRRAFNSDDPFREPRQIEQLQRLLLRHEQKKRDAGKA